MKSFSAILVASVLTVLFAGSEGVSLNLAGLRPDLEYLRGYWLKNPDEYYRQGRIIFSNNNEIVVGFGISSHLREYPRCPANIANQYAAESLQLKNVHHLSSNTSTLSFNSLFYKHGTFYISKNPCDLPQVVEDDDFDLKIPPIRFENDEKKSIQVLYTDLKTLGKDIEREVSKLDRESNIRLLKVLRKKPERRSGEGLFINSAENEFAVEYEKGLRYVDIPFVRLLETSPDRGDSSSLAFINGVGILPLRELPEYQAPDHHVSFLVSTDYAFIRFDRVTESFYTPGNESLDDSWFVRPFLRSYVLRDGVKFRSIPSGPRISYSQVARSTVRTLAPIVKAGALGLMHAMMGVH